MGFCDRICARLHFLSATSIADYRRVPALGDYLCEENKNKK